MIQSHGSTVADYLITRLAQAGARHMFGVPGDYVLDFMDHLAGSPVRLIGTCNELNAGYAADAYARINGIGAAVVTYDVGGLSILNAVAGAYAERVPLVVVSGAPHSDRRRQQTLMHHIATDYRLQQAIYAKLTVAAEVLADPERAPEQIDRALNACLQYKRPVYLEIPVDLVARPCRKPTAQWQMRSPVSDREALAESVQEAAALLGAAKRPAMLVGVEVHRFGLRQATVALLDKAGLPAATTVHGKTAIPEEHPDFVGVYQGALSREEVREAIEGADCLLMVGAWLTDITTGGFTAQLDSSRMISANSDRVKIRHHYFEQVYLTDFIPALTAALTATPARTRRPLHQRPKTPPFVAEPGRPLSVARFWPRMNQFLDESMIVLTDTGDSLIASADLETDKAESYIAQAYYLSIGYTVPGALGISLAKPAKRAVVFVGDGAFQMTAQELSTIIRQGAAPVFFLMNNDGYAVERAIHDGPYNEIQPWKYHRLPGVFGEALSMEVRTEDQLEDALAKVKEHRDKLVFIEVHLARTDYSDAVRRLGKLLRKLSVE
jgi:indolepyruvate decarboxylase